MDIIVTNKGGEKVCYEGYMYVLQNRCKSHVRWRCAKWHTLKCPGILFTSHEKTNPILKKQHKHPADRTSILVAKAMQEMKQKVNSPSASLVEIFKETVDNLDKKILKKMPLPESIKRTLRYHRQKRKQGLDPQSPKESNNFCFNFETTNEATLASSDFVGNFNSEPITTLNAANPGFSWSDLESQTAESECDDEVDVKPVSILQNPISLKRLKCSGMERWQGRVAFITGVSSSIGTSICVELIKNGLKVIGCSRNIENIEILAKTLPPNALLGIKCDLRNESEIMYMFREIKKLFGGIDICINNASLSTPLSLINGDMDGLRAALDVNVLALCLCSREAIKLMKENNIDDGQIINISSEFAHHGDISLCSGTNTLIHILTENLRQELRAINSHIRVACIKPGITKNSSRMQQNDNTTDYTHSSMKYLSPEDVAACVVSILGMPEHVDINDITLRSIEQKS